MSWTVQHLPAPYSEQVIDAWSAELRMVMPDWDWKVISPLFDCAGAFTIPASEARRMAGVLQVAALSVRMHPSMVPITEAMARAAETAANNRQPWRWR